MSAKGTNARRRLSWRQKPVIIGGGIWAWASPTSSKRGRSDIPSSNRIPDKAARRDATVAAFACSGRRAKHPSDARIDRDLSQLRVSDLGSMSGCAKAAICF